MINQRLQEISEQLDAANRIKLDIIKRKEQISPGLRDHINLLQTRQQSFKDALDLWRIMKKVYPGYGRNN